MKKIMLDCSRLKERDAMRDYMIELFGFSKEDDFTGNLDHLNDLPYKSLHKHHACLCLRDAALTHIEHGLIVQLTNRCAV